MQDESRKCDVKRKKKKSVLKCKKPSKNIIKKFRRRKNKTRYYNSLKHKRFRMKTEDLCESVAVFGITDMECGTSPCTSVFTDVADWHKQDQIAYWKSRAISLEYENRMLHNHLRHVYSTQIAENNSGLSKFTSVNDKKNKNIIKQNDLVIPKELEVKKRREEMKKIYGDQSAKILGMETAVQLNFERHCENTKAAHWPNIPLKL